VSRELNIKLKAVELRQNGYLFSEIAAELNIAKSTAYSWTSRIELTAKQLELIADKRKRLQRQQIDKLALLRKQRTVNNNHQINLEALRVVGNLDLSKEVKKILCATLFWCEGGKDVASGIYFINSDPVMVRTFLSLLRKSFALDERKFRALVHLHEYHNKSTQLKYWSELTRIPIDQFHKSYLKPHTGKNTRHGYPGCISIRYLDSSLGKLLKMIYIELGKNVGV